MALWRRYRGWVVGNLIACAMLSGKAQVQDLPVMARDAHPAFEVATVKLTDPHDQARGFHTRGRKLYIENETVRDMLMAAFDLQPRQIAGEPEWVDTEHFDVEGVPDQPGMPVWPQYQEMVQKLLTERFGLRFGRNSGR